MHYKFILLIGLLAGGQALSAEELRTIAVPLLTNGGRFIPGSLLPAPLGVKPGYTVLVQNADGGALRADAYRITIRFRQNGVDYERVQIAVRDGQAYTGSVFHVEGVVVSATASPIYWDTFKVGG